MRFVDVESLEGAADNEDVFVLLGGASLSGGVEGGDGGFDTVAHFEPNGSPDYRVAMLVKELG